MSDLDRFAPLGKPTSNIPVCEDAELARRCGHGMPDYPDEMNDGSRPATYREYEMWMLGRKYAHALYEGTIHDERAMNEAKAQAELVRERVQGFRHGQCWHADNQREFLEVLAGGGTVTDACAIVGLSKQSAYQLRGRDTRFREGWEAAQMLAYPRLVDELVERALQGQLETWQRITPDGRSTQVIKQRVDNAHSMRVLQYLAAPRDVTPRMRRVSRAAKDFDAFLGTIGTAVEDLPATPGTKSAQRAAERAAAGKAAARNAELDAEAAAEAAAEAYGEGAEAVDDRLTVASQAPDAVARPVANPADEFDYDGPEDGFDEDDEFDEDEVDEIAEMMLEFEAEIAEENELDEAEALATLARRRPGE